MILYYEKQSKQEKYTSLIRKFIKLGKYVERERERESAGIEKLRVYNEKKQNLERPEHKKIQLSRGYNGKKYNI